MTTLPLERRAAPSATRPASHAAAQSAAGQSLWSKMLGRIGVWNSRRAIRDDLNRLTDRELSDIGVARGDIEKVVRSDYRG